MLDLTKEEKTVLIFIAAAFLIGSIFSYLRNAPAAGSLYAGLEAAPVKDTGPVNINTADINGLLTIKGVGVKTAERIVEYRQVHGPFFAKDDIMKIKGIGGAKYEAMKDKIGVE